jgi:3-deoxy-D-manno-octulosonate 8-phosphate phosphatase (KDO 8-P phosphatase)
MPKAITYEIIEKAKKIKLILMDVDGVLTDGNIIYLDNGIIGRTFNVYDGLGIDLAHLAGLNTGVISAKNSLSIKKRLEELNVKFIYLGIENKVSALEKIINESQIDNQEIAFIGDDIIDIPVFKRVGLSIAVANATKLVKLAADYTTYASGGNGAVRESIEIILKAQNLFDKVINKIIS